MMKQMLTFHDYKPEMISFHDAVIDGLSKKSKSIPSKFFYDERGSQLFDLICEQPEYYPPVIERRLLKKRALEIAALTSRGRLLIEPGAGSLEKVRLLLDALHPIAYVPQDISFEHLKSAAHALVADYPWLPIHAVRADFAQTLPIPETTPEAPRLIFFPGSSIGNFNQSEAKTFLHMLRQTAGVGGMLLIGVDTKKSETVLNAAYNDKSGATSAFNLNIISRLRTELGMDCDPINFEHKAFYNAIAGRIEMHLVSRIKQSLVLNGYRFELEKGETIHTENSYKYTPQEFLSLAFKSGFAKIRHWQDKNKLFTVYLLAAN